MKFERFSSRNIENTNDRRSFDDVSKDMKDSADEINRLLEKINLNDEESPTSSLENLPSFDKHRAQRFRTEAMQENRETRYGIDQEAARRGESEEIKEHLHSIYANMPKNKNTPSSASDELAKNPSNEDGDEEEMKKNIEDLMKELGGIFDL